MISKNFHILKVKDIYDKFGNGTLYVDNSYQRRKIWNDIDKVRLIETILLGYLVPSLYLWDAETDADTGKTITHIVDGQQRINAIVDYIEDRFSLTKSSLTHVEGNESFVNKRFSELENADKIKIWAYDIPVVQLANIDSVETIKKVFYRLNLTDYNLREQEKRHSTSNGLFAELAIEISENDFWTENNIFNAGDIKRMKDIEFCASLLLLAREGIINQTTQKVLNEAYDDYKEVYPDREIDKQRILEWIEEVKKLINDATLGFVQKKSQLYTIFSVIDYLKRNNKEITEKMIINFQEFVKEYVAFKNSESGEQIAYKVILNKYKLAASEGIHKQKNRMIRFNIMKDVIIKGLYNISSEA